MSKKSEKPKAPRSPSPASSGDSSSGSDSYSSAPDHIIDLHDIMDDKPVNNKKKISYR